MSIEPESSKPKTTGGTFDSNFNFNTFTNLQNDSGVYGYPGSHNTFDNNTFTKVGEALHLVATVSNIDVSGNVITQSSRIGIELGDGMQILSIKNNWIGNWAGTGQGHMGISCATGGTGSTDGRVNAGSNITISGNTVLDDGEGLTNSANHWQDACIEIMGMNITITGNLCWNWAAFILNGQWGNTTVSGNQIYGGGLTSNDGVNPAPLPIVTSDRMQTLSAYTPSSTVPIVSPILGAAPK